MDGWQNLRWVEVLPGVGGTPLRGEMAAGSGAFSSIALRMI